MKAYVVYFIVIMFVFSGSIFGQSANHTSAIAANGSTTLKPDNTSKDGLVIVAYYVEETINMPFGKRVTKYEVSKLDMVSTYDLGPNNSRVVTPIYRKPKVKTTEIAGLKSTAVVDAVPAKVTPVKVDVITPSETPKYLTIDVVKTYAKVLDKGYRSVEMLTKVADRAYFDGDLATAAKYYTELFDLNTKLDAMYYYRYAQSLRGIDQTKKADEMMKLFETKNLSYKVSVVRE